MPPNDLWPKAYGADVMKYVEWSRVDSPITEGPWPGTRSSVVCVLQYHLVNQISLRKVLEIKTLPTY